MDSWNRLRDPIATLLFGCLTAAVALGWMPEALDRELVLESVTAAMTIAAAFATMANRKARASE